MSSSITTAARLESTPRQRAEFSTGQWSLRRGVWSTQPSQHAAGISTKAATQRVDNLAHVEASKRTRIVVRDTSTGQVEGECDSSKTSGLEISSCSPATVITVLCRHASILGMHMGGWKADKPVKQLDSPKTTYKGAEKPAEVRGDEKSGECPRKASKPKANLKNELILGTQLGGWAEDSSSTTVDDPLLPFVDKGLANSVHPILFKEQFHGQLNWLYEVNLLPSLRLASRFMAMDSVVKHLVIMVDGQLRRDTQPWGAGIKTDPAELASLTDAQGQPLFPNVGRYPTADHDIVDEKMRERATEIWMELKDAVRIRSLPLHKFDGGLHALSLRGSNPASKAAFARVDFAGADPARSTLIVISDLKVHEMMMMYHIRNMCGRRTNDVEWDLQVREVMLASDILHELFHAVETFYNGDRGDGVCETFYADSPMAECGFAGVAAALGGNPTLHHAKKIDPKFGLRGWKGTSLLMREWPSKTVQSDYQGKYRFGSRAPSPLDDESSPEKTHQDNSELTRVRMRDLKKLFQDKFWETEVPKFRQMPLFEKGVLRCRKKVSPKQQATCRLS